MPGPVFLDGDGVTLRPAVEEDLEFLLENENDPRVRRSRSVSAPTGPDDARRRLGGTMGRNGDTVALLVCTDAEPVGFAYLLREQPNDDVFRRAALAYWITPEKWENGYATAAAERLLGHGFDRLGLHKVTAKTHDFNDASQRVLEKLGFEREGVLHDEAFIDGAFHDFYRYGLLEDAWHERR